MKSKEELKKLFENGDKPTQENFWEWQDSYWHKDEKLPTDNAGLYKIKGSVADKTALDALTGMSEGDVYNLLDTGANYVYVLDLNNTGIAGWDDFFGTVDLSSINLQTVLDNGGLASDSDSGSLFRFDLINKVFATFLIDGVKQSTLELRPSQISISRYSENGYLTSVEIRENALEYGDDYSDRFTDRSLVDKAYVDNKVAPSTLQNVLENGGTASFNNETQTAFYAMTQGGFQAQTSNQSGNGSIGLQSTGQFTITRNGKMVNMTDNGLTYQQDYSTDFVDRSLVDKAYVDNKVAPAATLQTVLNNGATASSPTGYAMVDIGLLENSPFFNVFMQEYNGDLNTQFLLSKEGININCTDSTPSVNHTMEFSFTPVGARYRYDYSALWDDRNLVDKGYVDNSTSTYLPLSGTVAGKPLTGNIALSYTNFISGSGDYQSKLEFVGDSSELYSVTPMFRNSVRVSSDAVVLRSNRRDISDYSEISVRTGLIKIKTVEGGIAARGLTGDEDYTANITALDYVQKKYVDDAIANSTTPIEEIVLAGSNGLTGKIRYEKRGEFMNIHVDITVGELQVDESFSTILPFDLKTSFIVHPMITDIVNYFYTDIIIKTDGNDLLFINKTDAVITGGLIKQSFVFALGAD